MLPSTNKFVVNSFKSHVIKAISGLLLFSAAVPAHARPLYEGSRVTRKIVESAPVVRSAAAADIRLRVGDTIPDDGLFKVGAARGADQSGVKIIRVRNSRPRVRLKAARKVSAGEAVTIIADVFDRGAADQQAGFLYDWSALGGLTSTPGPDAQFTVSYGSVGRFRVRVRAMDKDGSWSRPTSRLISVAAAEGTTENPTPTPNHNSQPDSNDPPADYPAPTPSGAPQVETPPSTETLPQPTPVVQPPAPTPPPIVPAPPPPAEEPLVSVAPREVTGYVANPGMGLEANDRVETRDVNGLPVSLSYYKYYWKDLEPQSGRYDFSRIDQHMADAASRGQRFAFRVVTVDNLVSAPSWLPRTSGSGTSFSYGGGPTVWAPNFDTSTVYEAHRKFLTALGARYDGNANLHHVDIGSIGLWGEWHFWSTSPQVRMPSNTTLYKVIDQYFLVFPNTPLVSQLEVPTFLKYAVGKGAGFRGDCLGNMRAHMIDQYPNNIASAGVQSAWVSGPIAFETCWDISYWVRQGWNLRWIFDWALSQHVSSFNNKNQPIPASARAEVDRFLRLMGFRFHIRRAVHPGAVTKGGRIQLTFEVENKGVAKAYSAEELTVELRDSSNRARGTFWTGQFARSWLPGVRTLQVAATAPVDPGTYSIWVSIRNRRKTDHWLRLADQLTESSGWYRLSEITVK